MYVPLQMFLLQMREAEQKPRIMYGIENIQTGKVLHRKKNIQRKLLVIVSLHNIV